MHLGHLVPFLMTKWLQDAFDVPLVIQMTDDEKFLWKGEYVDGDDNLEWFSGLAIENAKDIIACGFKKEKTFLFRDTDYIQHMYPNILRIQKAVNYNVASKMFGFNKENNIGQSAFPAIQASPSFPSTFQIPFSCDRSSTLSCLVPCAIDQDPYFRMTRDVAHKLTPKNHPLGGKPSLIHSKFFPPLQGTDGKMSSSDDNSAIFLTDTPEDIERKIKKFAFSGGQETSKEQRAKGANLETDVSYQWLRFFLDDDELLERIGKEYGSGTGEYWATGVVKNKLIDVLKKLIADHQERRNKVTNEEVYEWMKIRALDMSC
jgi:tryptophanyl-tRNA synthetase